MFVAVFFLLLIGGGITLAYCKVEGFRKIVKGIFNASDNGAVSKNDIARAKEKLAKEIEKTAALEDWAATQTLINAERAKQAKARVTIQGGKK